MKTTLQHFTAFFILTLTLTTSAFSQIAVVSSNGYAVNIVISPKTIVTSSGSCQYGYNYNVGLQYAVTFTGNNRPSSLYTLQGTLGCGSATHFFDLPNAQGTGTVTSQSNVWRSVSDCATASVSSLLCTLVTIEIEGPGIPRQFRTFSTTSVPLPVKLVSFNATALRDKVKLTWATATETNSDHFVIERKATGTSDWKAVTTVTAKGNSAEMTTYEAFDANPGNGTIEYRLKTVDTDDNADYSAIKLVSFAGKTPAIDIYPVPNAGNTINFRSMQNPSEFSMTVMNMTGGQLYSTNLTSASIELPALKAGFYIVKLTNKLTGETTSLRYVKG